MNLLQSVGWGLRYLLGSVETDWQTSSRETADLSLSNDGGVEDLCLLVGLAEVADCKVVDTVDFNGCDVNE